MAAEAAYMMSPAFPCGVVPADEHVEWRTGSPGVHDTVRGDFIRFMDPANLRGSGDPSGNGNEAVGALFYRRGNPYGATAKVTCTLPADDRELCDFLIDRFVGEFRTHPRGNEAAKSP